MIDNDATLTVLSELGRKFIGGMIVYDNQQKCISWINGYAAQLTGLRMGATKLDIQHYLSNFSPDDQILLASWVTDFQHGKSRKIEVTLHRKNKDSAQVCLSAYSLNDDSLTMVVIDDISREKEHENYLVEFGTKKNTTLDSVVHFLSGAVVLMRNLSLEASRSIKVDNAQRINDYLGLIVLNSNHCLDVVNSLLSEEHEKSPDVPVKRSWTNVVEKVRYIVENLRSSYPARTFVFDPSDGQVFTHVDEFKLLQIVNNFAFNAIKFSSPPASIIFNITESDSQVTVSVADAGIGIPDDLQPLLFNRHTKAGRTGLHGEPSFGKGLAICSDLALKMGAEIYFESVAGKGSTFYIVIPKRLKEGVL